jgi:hypothetical protein
MNTEFKYDNKTYHLPSNDEGEYITLKLATDNEMTDDKVEKVTIDNSKYVFVPNVITLISNESKNLSGDSNDNNFSRNNSGSFYSQFNESKIDDSYDFEGGGLKKGGKYPPFFFKSFKSSKKNKKTKGRKGPRKLNTRRRK